MKFNITSDYITTVEEEEIILQKSRLEQTNESGDGLVQFCCKTI